jgi:biotin transport system ATP-binding protein
VSGIVLDRVTVRVSVDGRPAPKTLLQELSLDLTERRIGVIGANGSGKSTLLRLLNGLVAPSDGTVRVDGADTVRSVREVRRRVGFVFTDPLSQLVMPTGREDVELSLRRSIRNGTERRAHAESVLERFGLLALADQSIYELSGGERQLLALAAVLAVDPDVLVLDEPSTLLDLRNRELLRRTLAGLRQQVILSTHDLELALDMDRVLVVDDGKVVFDGGPAAAVAHYRALSAAGLPAPGGGLAGSLGSGLAGGLGSGLAGGGLAGGGPERAAPDQARLEQS